MDFVANFWTQFSRNPQSHSISKNINDLTTCSILSVFYWHKNLHGKIFNSCSLSTLSKQTDTLILMKFIFKIVMFVLWNNNQKRKHFIKHYIRIHKCPNVPNLKEHNK